MRAQQLCLQGCRAQAQWLRRLGSAVVTPGLQSTGSVKAQQLCLPGSRAQAQWLRRLGSAAVTPGPQSTGSVVVVHGLGCSMAHGNFPDQGLNLSPLHWQVDSLLVDHHGSPNFTFNRLKFNF